MVARAGIACLAALIVSSGCASEQAKLVHAAKRATLTRRMGRTRATILYTPGRYGWVTHAQIRIARNERSVYRAGAPGFGQGESGFFLEDLNSDGEPEVIIQFSSGGYFCCVVGRVYSYDAARNTYISDTHSWGDGLGLPTLVDLDHDGRRELLSQDKRFHCAFGLCAAPRPIQIWTLRRGRFRDVTRRYRQVVERHATEIWRGYVRYRDNNHDVGHGELPAWAAEEYLLGRGSLVQARLQEARGKGYLADTDPNAVAFIRALNAFLQESGYESD